MRFMPDVKRLRLEEKEKKKESALQGDNNVPNKLVMPGHHPYVFPKPQSPMPLCVHCQVGIHFRGIQVINFNSIKKKFRDGLHRKRAHSESFSTSYIKFGW